MTFRARVFYTLIVITLVATFPAVVDAVATHAPWAPLALLAAGCAAFVAWGDRLLETD